jgi:hypothetical protein
LPIPHKPDYATSRLALLATFDIADNIRWLTAKNKPRSRPIGVFSVANPKPPRPAVQATRALIQAVPIRGFNGCSYSERPLETAMAGAVSRNEFQN